MTNNGVSLTHKMERKAVEVAVDKIIKGVEKDKEAQIEKIIELSKKW